MSLINDALRRANSDRPSGPQAAAPVPPMQPVDPAPSPSSRILPWAVLILGVAVLAIGAALFLRGRQSEPNQLARNEATPASEASPVTSSTTPTVANALTSVSSPQDSPALEAPLTSKPQPASPPQQQIVAATQPSSTIPEPVQSAPAIQPSVQPASPTSVATIHAVPQNTPAPPTSTPEPVVTKFAAAFPRQVEVKSAAPTESSPPRLQAIYYRLRKPTVVINGKTIGPGQSVDGIKIVSIQRTSVEVVQDGKYRTLTLQD
jgi:hypothetical protein